MNQAVVVVEHPRLRVSVLKAGKNPRTYYDPMEMAELKDSIRAVGGVIQPILVRPIDGGHEVVAGYRRWTGSREVLGEDYEIPVLIKEMSDEEAEELALTENVARANMSPAEEAESAARILGRCEGNRDEAAKHLGWSRQTFDKRLALMNCSPNVRRALIERKIQLGHAELLAAAPKDRQDKVIEKLLTAPSLPPIAQFKAQLEGLSKLLATAIFDKAGCAGCQFDSSIQGAMFTDAISTGHCTNAVCFDEKTMDVLEAKKKALLEEFPRVQIVSPGEQFTIIKLIAEGGTGVGEEQAKACRACANFGAVISNVPGKIGNVYSSQCFDSACNTGKVSARIKAEKEAAKPTTQPAAPATATAGAKSAPDGKQAKSAAVKPASTVPVKDSQRVIDYRIGVWRTAIKKELFADQRENLSMLIGILMTRGGSQVSSTKLLSVFEKLSGTRPSNSSNVGEASALVSKATDEVRSQMLSGIVLSIADSIDKDNLVQMLKFMEVDLAKHWKINAEFLGLLTKSEIDVTCEQIGLKAVLGDVYYKTINCKKDEMIKGLLATEGFDFAGKIPTSMRYDV